MSNQTRKVVFYSSLVVILMFGFCFALVPIYNKYCKVTGINTSQTLAEYEATPDLTRQITVQFVSTNNAELPWEFHPLHSKIKMHPGETKRMLFYVKNKSNKLMTVQAIPSYAPNEAINYLHKLECFCFNQQTLAKNEERDMPVVFRLDKNLPKKIRVITLSYTLFDVTPLKEQRIST